MLLLLLSDPVRIAFFPGDFFIGFFIHILRSLVVVVIGTDVASVLLENRGRQLLFEFITPKKERNRRINSSHRNEI